MPKLPQSIPKSEAQRWRFFSDGDCIHVVIETSKGQRNKMKFDPNRSAFVLHRVLPAGTTFPYDFGFVPQTKAEDGDPLDVLVLMDESVSQGSLVPARVIGIMEAVQKQNGQSIRNDRIIAVAAGAHDYRAVRKLADVSPNLLKELIHFFESYHEMQGDKFKCKGLRGPRVALRRIRDALVKDE